MEIDSLPEVFINVYRKKNYVECQTLDLVKFNQRITDAHNEVITMSDRTVQELIENACSAISGLFAASEAIAMLDMLAAFAQVASCQDYIRPELTEVLAIKAGRHPIREKIHANKFVPNDAYATQQERFQIITGCNMSGKSTYIRSLALMTVMAQIGCFIPAVYASFPIVHQLFARVSIADDLEANVSTFAVEMREMAFILRNIEARSMVIIDELGRGTSTTDGLAIAIAIAEGLLESHALVWFVTHFHDLAVILAERSGVVNFHLAAQTSADSSKMTMLYKIAEGPVTNKFYGLALARLVDLPPNVLEVAQGVSERLNEIAQRRQSKAKALIIARKRKLILSLREQLRQARDGRMEGEPLRKWLKERQDEFTLKMASIDKDLIVSTDSDGDDEDDVSLQIESEAVENSSSVLEQDRDGEEDDEDAYDEPEHSATSPEETSIVEISSESELDSDMEE